MRHFVKKVTYENINQEIDYFESKGFQLKDIKPASGTGFYLLIFITPEGVIPQSNEETVQF
jgi:hypothetical protein